MVKTILTWKLCILHHNWHPPLCGLIGNTSKSRRCTGAQKPTSESFDELEFPFSLRVLFLFACLPFLLTSATHWSPSMVNLTLYNPGYFTVLESGTYVWVTVTVFIISSSWRMGHTPEFYILKMAFFGLHFKWTNVTNFVSEYAMTF